MPELTFIGLVSITCNVPKTLQCDWEGLVLRAGSLGYMPKWLDPNSNQMDSDQKRATENLTS